MAKVESPFLIVNPKSYLYGEKSLELAKAADKKSDTTDTGVSDVTDGIDVIKDLVLGCVGGVGVIFLAWGLLDFGTAYAAHETTQQSQAIKKVIGGLIMIAVPAILKLLGVS